MKRPEQFQDMISRLYPELHTPNPNNQDKLISSHSVTFQVTDACNLACTYCYQINKGKRVMKFEYAKKLIDALLSGDERFGNYITLENSPGIILDFIGGEPLLEVELIEQICDYFYEQVIMLQHPWATRFRISIATNGTLHFDEKVQHFLKKYEKHISYGITVDGNKELHDSCRIFPDGRPSYDMAIAAVKDWAGKGHPIESKLTIAPENIDYIYDAILNLVDNGYEEIDANPVFEDVWHQEDAVKYYNQLKRLADYWNDNDLVDDIYFSLFEDTCFCPIPEEENKNFCGGTGDMLAMDPDGYLYPCIRYMESSLGNDVPPIVIGHVDIGIAQCDCHNKCLHCFDGITRRSQSTDECFYCPIGQGCAWCSAYNYQATGSPNKRAVTICEMHKARALANVYFWNTYYRKHNIIDEETGKQKRFKNYCPDEWALNIISQEELDMLKALAEED